MGSPLMGIMSGPLQSNSSSSPIARGSFFNRTANGFSSGPPPTLSFSLVCVDTEIIDIHKNAHYVVAEILLSIYYAGLATNV